MNRTLLIFRFQKNNNNNRIASQTKYVLENCSPVEVRSSIHLDEIYSERWNECDHGEINKGRKCDTDDLLCDGFYSQRTSCFDLSITRF